MNTDELFTTSANRQTETTQRQQKEALNIKAHQQANLPAPPNPSPQYSGVYWLRSKFPVSELNQKKCLICFHDGPITPGTVFTLEAQTHDAIAEYHQISARRSVQCETGGTSLLITFDQHRADQIKRPAQPTEDFAFIADIDIDRPLQYISTIQEAVDQHLQETLKALDEA